MKLFSNNRLIKTSAAITLCSCLALTAVNVYACPDKGKRMHYKGHQGSPMKMLNQLDLSKPQKEQIDNIFAANKVQRQSLRQQISQLKQELRDQNGKNAAVEESLIDEIHALKKQQRQIMRADRNKINTVLTAEQRQKLATLKQQRREMRHRKHQHHRDER